MITMKLSCDYCGVWVCKNCVSDPIMIIKIIKETWSIVKGSNSTYIIFVTMEDGKTKKVDSSQTTISELYCDLMRVIMEDYEENKQ